MTHNIRGCVAIFIPTHPLNIKTATIHFQESVFRPILQ